jgi:hypothetical protein
LDFKISFYATYLHFWVLVKTRTLILNNPLGSIDGFGPAVPSSKKDFLSKMVNKNVTEFILAQHLVPKKMPCPRSVFD